MKTFYFLQHLVNSLIELMYRVYVYRSLSNFDGVTRFSLHFIVGIRFRAVGMEASSGVGGGDTKARPGPLNTSIVYAFSAGTQDNKNRGSLVVLGTLTSGARRVAPHTHSHKF